MSELRQCSLMVRLLSIKESFDSFLEFLCQSMQYRKCAFSHVYSYRPADAIISCL